MTDYVLGTIFGIVVGSIFSVIIVCAPENQKLRECQKDLPRNQMCELIAVPIQEN